MWDPTQMSQMACRRLNINYELGSSRQFKSKGSQIRSCITIKYHIMLNFLFGLITHQLIYSFVVRRNDREINTINLKEI